MTTRAPLNALSCACALALGLAGCTAQNGGNWGQIVGMIGKSFDDKPVITLDDAGAVSFASLGVRVGDGPQMMVVLAANVGHDRLWTSKARFALTTRAGRVMRSSGLMHDLDAVSFQSGDAVLDAARSSGPRESLRFVDFHDINRYSVPLRCVAVSRGEDPVTILGKSIRAVRVDEECANSEIGWNFTDSFWIGSTGLVWKSIQHIHPDYDPLEIEILRPPEGAL